MSLNLDKSTWTRVTLGEVAAASKEKVDPYDGSVERYVAGEHMETDDLKIHRWGDVGEVDLGPAFHRRFRPGQVLYGSRRTYLRKVAVADFDGVCANTTFVVETKNKAVLLQEFLPFLMTSEPFHAFAIAESKGSVNPYVNWSDIERHVFDLPPLDEQKRIADLLWALERHLRSLNGERLRLDSLRGRCIENGLGKDVRSLPLGAAASIISGVTLGPARRTMPDSVPYLRVANVQRGLLDLDEIKEIGATPAEIESKGVRRGDVLVVEGHASVDEIGRAAIWDRDESPLFQNHLFRVRASRDFRPSFLLEWINSEGGRRYIRTVAKSTSGLNTINSTVLKAMPVPAAALEAQDQLLATLAIVDSGRAALALEVARLRALRSALHADILGGK